jgi:hypothetical protein
VHRGSLERAMGTQPIPSAAGQPFMSKSWALSPLPYYEAHAPPDHRWATCASSFCNKS